MRLIALLLFVSGIILAASFTNAQPPDFGKGGKGGGKGKGDKGGPGGPGGPGGGKSATVEEMVARMMTFDADKDGKLSKEEVTDSRLQSLFERADSDKDGYLTKEELTAFFTKEAAALNAQGGQGVGPGGFGGGPGGPGGGFPGGGPGGFGMPRPGEILPGFLQNDLNFTDEQKKKLAELQKEVDAKLEKILTDEQRKQLQNMRPGGPGGGPGGPGGRGGPGGPPPQE